MNNKLFLIFLLSVATVYTSFAQEEEKKKKKHINIGVRAGYNLGCMVKDGNSVNKSIDSFYLGVFKNHRFFPFLRTSIGLDYYQTGYKVDKNNKLRLSYIGIPWSLRAKVGPLYGQAGLNAALKIGSNDSVDQGSYKAHDKISPFDIGPFLGGGFKFLLAAIEVRYYWGGVNVGNGLHNQYLQIGAVLEL